MLDFDSWLYRIYQKLKTRFRQCNEQQHHNEEKVWVPHIGLGTFGSSSGARSVVRERCQENGIWKEATAQVQGLTLLKRGVNRNFRQVALVTLTGEQILVGNESDQNSFTMVLDLLRDKVKNSPASKAIIISSILGDAEKSASDFSKPYLDLHWNELVWLVIRLRKN